MSKLSSYQKLKEENLKLKQDLIVLSTEPNSGKGLAIRTKWTIVKDMEKSVWFTPDKIPTMFNGLLTAVEVRG